MAKAKNKSKKKPDTMSPRIVNRRARHDYHISDPLECGIALSGSEVKSIREGRVNLAEAFCRVDDKRMEIYLYNADIAAYGCSSAVTGHVPRQARKLLAKKREIKALFGKTTVKGTTIIPLEMYFNSRGFVKVKIGLAHGKKQHDKREDLKKKQANLDIKRAMTKKHLRA